MTDSPTPAMPEPRRMSGRRTVLLFLVLGPLIAIPLLLAGPMHERQVCLRTLAVRERHSFVVGSFPVRQSDWQRVPLDDAHAQWNARVFPDPVDNLWVTTWRTMPFIIIVSIPNTRVLSPGKSAILRARELAVEVLDPTHDEDTACARAFVAWLLEGVEPEATTARERRERRRQRYAPPPPGEQHALALRIPVAIPGHDTITREDLRLLLCHAPMALTAPVGPPPSSPPTTP